MTQDLANKLIAHYEKVILQVDSMYLVSDIIYFLRSINTHRGVCKCANAVFYETIYFDKWIQSFSGAYWAIAPKDCRTKSEILEALQFRVDRLKTFKESDQ